MHFVPFQTASKQNVSSQGVVYNDKLRAFPYVVCRLIDPGDGATSHLIRVIRSILVEDARPR